MVSSRGVERASKIIAEHGDMIRAIIRSQLFDQSKADDLFQEFFVSLAERPIPEYIEDIAGYLRRAIMHDIIDAGRRVGHERACLGRYAQRRRTFSFRDDPSKNAVRSELIGMLGRLARNQLRKRESQAIVYRFLCNHDTGLAAKLMGVDKRTVSRYVSIGIKRLRQHMDTQDRY
jgi:RNA polymerase sigma factor (sigma-70 family)